MLYARPLFFLSELISIVNVRYYVLFLSLIGEAVFYYPLRFCL